MRCNKKMIQTLLAGACLMLSYSASAQTDRPFVLSNPNDDFLLPSYFDTPSSTYVQSNTPMMAASAPKTQAPTNVDILDEIFGKQGQNNVPTAAPKTTTQHMAHTYYPSNNVTQNTSSKEKKAMLIPLDPIPPAPEPEIQPPKKTHNTSLYATRLLAKETGKSKAAITLPQDLRLMFEPNATQISATSVKWITAYALHVQKDPRLGLSIRVSNQNWPIQQARLGVLIKLLTEKGLSSKQIRIFQSNRDPDSMILNADIDANQTKIIVPDENKRIIREQKTVDW